MSRGAAVKGDVDSSAYSVYRRNFAVGDDTAGPTMCGCGALAYCLSRFNAKGSTVYFECTTEAERDILGVM